MINALRRLSARVERYLGIENSSLKLLVSAFCAVPILGIVQGDFAVPYRMLSWSAVCILASFKGRSTFGWLILSFGSPTLAFTMLGLAKKRPVDPETTDSLDVDLILGSIGVLVGMWVSSSTLPVYVSLVNWLVMLVGSAMLIQRVLYAIDEMED